MERDGIKIKRKLKTIPVSKVCRGTGLPDTWHTIQRSHVRYNIYNSNMCAVRAVEMSSFDTPRWRESGNNTILIAVEREYIIGDQTGWSRVKPLRVAFNRSGQGDKKLEFYALGTQFAIDFCYGLAFVVNGTCEATVALDEWLNKPGEYYRVSMWREEHAGQQVVRIASRCFDRITLPIEVARGFVANVFSEYHKETLKELHGAPHQDRVVIRDDGMKGHVTDRTDDGREWVWWADGSKSWIDGSTDPLNKENDYE